MPRKKNVISKLVVDYGKPGSVANAIARIKGMERKAVKADAALGKQADAIEALFLRPLLKELAWYPPRKKGMKIRWASDKQRRYVLLLLRKQFMARTGRAPRAGDDISYVRTGTFGDSWVAVAIPTTNGLRVRIYNTAENEAGIRYAPFVVGNIGLGVSDRSAGRYLKPQQRFHQDRGWKQAAPLIQRSMAKIKEYASDEFGRTLVSIEGEK